MAVFLSAIVATTFSVGASDAADITVAHIEAAYREWTVGVSFAASFRQVEGLSASIDRAFEADPFDTVLAKATGLLNKSGETLRYAIEWESGPQVVGIQTPTGDISQPPPDEGGDFSSPAGGQLLVRNGAIDELCTSELLMSYTKRWRNMYDRATYSRRADLIPEPGERRCSAAEERFSSLVPVPGCFAGFPGTARWDSHFRIEKIGEETVAIVSDGTGSGDGQGGRHEYRSEWSLRWDIPVLTRVVREYYNSKGVLEVFVESRLSNFIELADGFAVARRVVYCTSTTPGSRPFVRVWESDDLGEREPTEQDFIVEIAPTTVIVGLADAPPPGTQRRLSVQGVLMSDVFPTGTMILDGKGVPPGEEPKRGAPTPRNPSGWLIYVNVIVVGIVAVLYLARRSRRNRSVER
ncbi:MAG: hypothetical protein ACK5Q5_13515 [Planctomycetaceae bacterium]